MPQSSRFRLVSRSFPPNKPLLLNGFGTLENVFAFSLELF
jgi:hypothetical protein